MMTATIILTLFLSSQAVMVEAPQTKVEMVAMISEPIELEVFQAEELAIESDFVAPTTPLSDGNAQLMSYPTGFT